MPGARRPTDQSSLSIVIDELHVGIVLLRGCVRVCVSRFLYLAPPHSVRILRGSMRATHTLDDANFGFYVLC